MRPRTCIGRRIGARRPPDRALVDEYRATKILCATEFLRIVDFCGPESLIEARLQVAVQDFVQECRFARTGDSRDTHELAERHVDIYVLYIELVRAANFYLALIGCPPLRRQRYCLFSPQIRKRA